MGAIDLVLGTDFEGRPANPAEVLSAGLGDVRRISRVPELRNILYNPKSGAHDQFIACIALTTWAIEDGYRAVIDACSKPGDHAWLGLSIDRMYSVDNTFAQLAMAVDSSRWVSGATGTESLRLECLRALVGVADVVYFDGQLEGIVMDDARPDVVQAVSDVVRRGVARLQSGEEQKWDLATQLIDITAGVAVKASRTAVDLTVDLVTVSPNPRSLRHAVDVVARADPLDSADLADLLCAFGGDSISSLVVAAQNERRRSPGMS